MPRGEDLINIDREYVVTDEADDTPETRHTPDTLSCSLDGAYRNDGICDLCPLVR